MDVLSVRHALYLGALADTESAGRALFNKGNLNVLLCQLRLTKSIMK